MVECNRNASEGYLALESLCRETGEAERESRSKRFHNGGLASQGAQPTVPSEPTAGPWSSFFIMLRDLEGKKQLFAPGPVALCFLLPYKSLSGALR